ncbi:MAG: hypothetical protein LBD24_09660 [Spirochaetaceae bacterium]|nr:hypothetical protein [Spirochaetaceae bacterium]
MHHFEATGGHAEAVGDGPEAAAMLKPSETGRAWAAARLLTGQGVALL